jgi:branched-chain amino acid aminotransferase
MAVPPYIQANTDGRLHDAAEPALSVLNRGFLYGDAIYEVWRTYAGVVFAWEEHWARLERSAAALHLPLPLTAAAMWREVIRTAASYRALTGDAGELYIRLQISRGHGPIGLDPALADAASWVIVVQALASPTPAARARGLQLSLARELHRNAPGTLNPAWKTGNYLNNILCLREARVRGADEVLMTNLAGELTEAAVCNVAWVRHGVLLTPPLSAGILGGITRAWLGEHVAPGLGVAMHETVLRPADLAAMDECFLLSTTKDIQPVASIDTISYRVGPDTLTSRLKEAFINSARDHARRHPDRRV